MACGIGAVASLSSLEAFHPQKRIVSGHEIRLAALSIKSASNRTRIAARKPAARPCEWHGCKEKATNKAPKGRGNDKDYWNFCLKHAREYNQSYNFFAGMNDDAVLAYPEGRADRPSSDLEDGHRQAARSGPIWAPGTGDDPFGLFGEGHAQRAAEAQTEQRPDPQRRAQGARARSGSMSAPRRSR